jgi:hypothetical protein
MKITITKLALLFFSLSLVSCSEEALDTSENTKKMLQVNSCLEKDETLPMNLQNRHSMTGFCFNFEYPIYVNYNDEKHSINDDSQLNEIIQHHGIDWLITTIDYPIRATNIVTSESNLGDVPIAYEGGNNNNNGDGIGSNIVTSESNLGDVPRALDINSQEELLRLLQNCK